MRPSKITEFDCYFCDICRNYTYDESVGDPVRAIPQGTCVDALPLAWKCPVCGAGKAQLRASTLVDGFTYDNPTARRSDKPALIDGAVRV